MKIGQAIKELRKNKGMKQNVFCQKIGISATSLSQIENDLKYPHQNTLKAIAKTLEVPEQMIYLLSMTSEDIPAHKREIYNNAFPLIKALIYQIIN